MYDELSVSFENPATDALGYQRIQGKLFCGRDHLELQFKEFDRAFRKGETQVLRLEYGEVERTEFVSKWFRPKILILTTKSSEKLSHFPGNEVGRIELQIIPESVKWARRVAKLIEFRQSDAELEALEDRLQGIRDQE